VCALGPGLRTFVVSVAVHSLCLPLPHAHRHLFLLRLRHSAHAHLFRRLFTDLFSLLCYFFFFSSRRRHTRFSRDWSSDVCSSDLFIMPAAIMFPLLTTGHYQGGKLEMSLIEIVWSVGMLIGGTVLGAVKIRIHKIIMVNTMHILLGTSFILCGGLPTGWFIGYVTTTFLGGVAISIFSSSFAAILQEEIAPS